MNIDSKEFQSLGRVARSSADIISDIDADIDAWANSESAASSNTKSGGNWLDTVTKATTTAADLFSKYTQSKTPTVTQNQVSSSATPSWLLPVGLGAAGLILLIAFDSKKN
ncbi:hypothetical protein OKW21_000601 [Catalinimonas alkaloidigena]|uniref:hypothetical protein n=1 Tax=Catalinimonas alkaloidigena TaxID=1075417 RepID=UPI002404A7C0|nr:hypothetical protein [Catalinimonas alkaloidigena]MDF9795338.1 hypothetical protein [Catalinimonas alkaloidigena]